MEQIIVMARKETQTVKKFFLLNLIFITIPTKEFLKIIF
jgi:hypothetical protein